MDWEAVVRQLHKEARGHTKVVHAAQDNQMIQFGAAVTSAMLVSLAHAIEKGLSKFDKGKQ